MVLLVEWVAGTAPCLAVLGVAVVNSGVPMVKVALLHFHCSHNETKQNVKVVYKENYSTQAQQCAAKFHPLNAALISIYTPEPAG